MANKITESRLIPFNVQKGEGVPTHISPSGTLFFDTLSGVTYQNIDGLNNWSTLFGPTNKPQDIYVTGGTYDFTSGVATFRNNAGGSFTLFGFNIGGGGGGTFTGGTVVGGANFLAGLTSTTITSNSVSATTYYNLPIDIRVTGGTYSNGTAIFTNNTGGTFNLSGFTTPSSLLGSYLPLSGGTVSGNTIFTSGLTGDTLYITNYIDFNTGTTNPLPVGGRIFFDNTSKALSYYDVLSNPVPIAMGQQLYTRVYNASGAQIDKGKVVTITGTSNGLPSAALATNNHKVASARPIGLAAENIPNNSEGLILNNGILSGITLNTFANGDTLYLSDTVAGGYVSNTSSLTFTARTNEIGYVIQTGSTTGKIYVNINNEDSNLSLTDIERNILEGNVISSGAYQYTGMTQGTGQTINVAQVRGWVVKNTYDYATVPDVTNINYTGGTNIPLTNLNSADATFILVNSASTLVQQTTFPTPQQRRENILLGKVVHPNRSTITSLNQTVDFDVSPMAAIRDIWTPLKLINQGIIVSPHSTTLEIDTSAGTLWGNGIGWVTNQQNPDSISISGTSPTTFQYRSRLGPITGSTSNPGDPSAPTGNTTTIDSHHYDLNGVIVPVGGNNRATNQRIYLFPTGLIRIQYGQYSYSTMANAIAGIDTEIFVEYGNNRDNGILIGILTVREDASDLSSTGDAQFRFVSKFGELLAGAGGISTTTLQQAYDNSTTPEIVINAALDGLTIKNGTGNADATTHLLEGQNTAGAVTSFIMADGGFSGLSVSAVTVVTPSVTANANGLTATTISATTYQNLPTDIRTTGATYSNNTFTFTNNTGGTYSVLFNTVSGLTVNGNLTVTGNTSLQALTATTISATTVSSPFTTGSVIFQGSGGTLTQNNSKLFWDNTNNRFGLGTATPAYPFDAQHIGISGTTGRLTFRNDNNAYSVLALFSDGVGLTLQSHTSGGGYVSANNALNFTANDATNPTTIWVGNGSRFRVGNSAGTAEYLRISPSGNTLIGTTTDSGYKLDVLGNTRLSGDTLVSGGSLTVLGTVSTDAAVFGAELVTTGITASGTNWSGTSLATGYVHTPGSASALTSNLSATTNTSYIITYTVSGNTAGRYESITFGGVTYMIYANNTTNTITLRSVSTGPLSVVVQSATDGTIAITSVKAINDSTSLVTHKNSSNTNIVQQRASSNQLYYGLNAGAKFNSLTINNAAFGPSNLSLNTSGNYNTAMGVSTLQQVTNSSYLTAIGYNVFQNLNTAGNLYNVGVGGNIGGGLTTGATGYGNILIGFGVGNALTATSANIGMGYSTLNNTTNGSNNIAIGTTSLNNNISGSNNIAVGHASGNLSSSGTSAGDSTSSVFLGYDTRPLSSGQTNQIVIGSTAIGIGSNSVVLGNDSVTKTALKGNVLIGTTADTGTYKLDVNGRGRFIGGTASSGLVVTGGLTGNDINLGGIIFLGTDTFYKGSFIYSYDSKLLTINGGDVDGNIAFKSSNTERMRVNTQGNVLIGTTADTGTYKLDVLGSTRVSGLTSTNGMYSVSAYTGSFTDGIVADYVTGNGRISVGTGDSITFYNGGVAVTPLVIITSGGTLLVNTTADTNTYKLDVNGTTRLNGNTTILASTGTTLLTIGGFNNLPELRFIDNNVKITRDSNGIMNFLGQYGAATNHFSFSSTSNLANTLSAGTGSFINASLTFAPVSGNAVFNFVTLTPTINQTGTTSGITRGLYINPTLTSAYDYRAIETTAGKVIFGGANQIGTETAKLRVLSGYEGGSMNGLLVEANGNTYTSILRHTGSGPASLFIDAAQSGLTSMVRALYINGSSSLANYVTFAESGATKFNISRAGDLTTSGSLYVTGNTISNTFNGTSDTISGTKGTVTISGGSTTAFINVSGSNTIGGTGYTDFLRVTNTAAGATNSTKTIRVNNTGGMEILNNAYTAVTLSIGDNGILYIGGGAAAITSNNDASSNYLYFNGNNSQIYDDGNMHIHSRGSAQSMWLNANNGSIILGNQSPVSGGGAATSIIMGSASTVTKAYVNIYGSKTYTIGSYGFLATSGAGTGGGTTAPYSLYCNNRIEATEFDATSDERLKDIQGEIELNEAINLVNNIKPIKYFWKDSEDKSMKTGYSAQQVEKSGFNHLIGHILNDNLLATTDSDGFTSPEGFQLTMNYDQVIPYHGVVIKHLLEKIDELQKQIDELKAK